MSEPWRDWDVEDEPDFDADELGIDPEEEEECEDDDERGDDHGEGEDAAEATGTSSGITTVL